MEETIQRTTTEEVETPEPMRYYYFNKQTNAFVYGLDHYYAEKTASMQVFHSPASLKVNEPFLKMVNGTLSVMNTQEKAAEALRITLKNAPYRIDSYVGTKIFKDGFTYNGKKYSLSEKAQLNWNRLAARALASDAPSAFNVTAQSSETVELKKEDVSAFIKAASEKIDAELNEGRETKNAIKNMETAKQIISHLTINGIIAESENQEYL